MLASHLRSGSLSAVDLKRIGEYFENNDTAFCWGWEVGGQTF